VQQMTVQDQLWDRAKIKARQEKIVAFVKLVL